MSNATPYNRMARVWLHDAEDAPVTHQDAERAARLASGIVASIRQDLDNHGFIGSS